MEDYSEVRRILMSFKVNTEEKERILELERAFGVREGYSFDDKLLRSAMFRDLVNRAYDLWRIPADTYNEWQELAKLRHEHPADTLKWMVAEAVSRSRERHRRRTT